MRFEVGQMIWIGNFSSHTSSYETCPDCGGTGRMRVTFHDDTQVSIECRNCSQGYDPPSGRILVYNPVARAQHVAITGLEIEGGKTRWHVNSHGSGYIIIDDDQAFDTEHEALISAKSRAADYVKEQQDRIFSKEKDSRSWASNASYHRKCLKEAQRQIEYHSAKLAVAVIKAKEPQIT